MRRQGCYYQAHFGIKRVKRYVRAVCPVTIEPGCTLGYHEHHGESETYYILTGEGMYNNGTKRPRTAGVVTFTPDGRGHALDNIGCKVLSLWR